VYRGVVVRSGIDWYGARNEWDGVVIASLRWQYFGVSENIFVYCQDMFNVLLELIGLLVCG
jgi:hypothetical protein